jgi:tetratricopeptide (TPR) repeat protein
VDAAKKKLEAQDFAGAKADLTRAAAADPGDYQAVFFLGVAQEGLEDAAGARASYEKAIAIDPKRPEGYMNLSAILVDAGEAERALEIIDKGLELAPKDPTLLTNRALALDIAGKKKEAVAAYAKALGAQQDPPPMLRYQYALALADAGEKDRALAELRSLVASADPDVLVPAASLFTKLEAYADCVAALDKVLAGKPSPDLHLSRGVCRHKLEDMKGAKADYEAASKLDPTFAPAHYYLGVYYMDSKDKKNACAEYKQAAAKGAGGLKKAAEAGMKKLGCK